MLLQAAERLAAVTGKLVTAGDEHAKRTALVAKGRLDVLRRLAAPGDDDVVWVERVGRSRRLRIAPVAAGETIANALLAWRPVIGVSATLGGDPPFPALARQMGLQGDTPAGSWGEQDEDDGHWISNAGRGYASVQTPSSFDWKEQGILYVGQGSSRSVAGSATRGWMRPRIGCASSSTPPAVGRSCCARRTRTSNGSRRC